MKELNKIAKIFTNNQHLQIDIVSILKTEKYLNIEEFFESETDTHTARVGELSKNIGVYLNLEKEQLEELKILSPLHDLGKLLVPRNILNKPSKLTFDEFEIIKKHPVDGFNLLMKSDNIILKHSAKISLEHHEKWNGKGYPFSKKEDETHIYSRIVSVSDVIDSLISDRVYKKGWSKIDVGNLLKEEKGKHFDPRIISVVLSNFDEIIQKTYKK